MNKKLSVLLVSVLAVTACDTTETPDTGEPPSKTAGQAAPMEKTVAKKSDAASEESCLVYFKEVAQTCHGSIYEGLDISCKTAVMKAKVAFSQQKGNLFTDPNGNVAASEIGNAICAGNLKSLRRKLNKAVTEPKKDWGPNCTSYMKRLVSGCITPIAKGEFSDSCSTGISSIDSLKQNHTPESMCVTFSEMLPQ